MKQPENPNYAAIITRVGEVHAIPGADRIKSIRVFGMTSIVSADTREGDWVVVLPTECQVSDEFARVNNLYRHSELNADPTHTGYLEDNRRVRAIKLRGMVSSTIVLPLSALAYTKVKLDDLREGDTFDELNGHEICKKFVRPVKVHTPRNQQRTATTYVDPHVFPEQDHVIHWARVVNDMPAHREYIVTQKLHGTNIRVGHVPVERKLSLMERIAARLGIRVQRTKYSHVYGSHHVVKGISDAQQHFYGEDIWTREGQRIKDVVPQNWVVFGELVGWVRENTPIQPNYTYDVPNGEARLYVYRVVITNDQGVQVELPWDSVMDWCRDVGLYHVPELVRYSSKVVLNVGLNAIIGTKFAGTQPWCSEPVPLSPTSPCDEGVVIRVESLSPNFYKVKADAFLEHESKALDTDEGIDE